MQDNADKVTPWLSIFFDPRWVQLIAEAWKLGRKIFRGFANEGVYEVLDYAIQVELKDGEGKIAHIQKREKIRYLQDYITSFQDQAWGNGEFLLNYKCSPGVPVDQYQLGHNTYKLISLREFRNKGDIDHFNIEWKMKNSFLKATGFWGTAINQRTKKITIQVIFPINRPPLRASIFEKNVQRTHVLAKDIQQKLTDGRQTIIWTMDNPRLYEDYVLSWEW